MGRRRPSMKDPPESVSWTEHSPVTPQYWMYGGPWIHPDDIPPQHWDEKWLGGGMKGEEARKRYVREIVESCRRDLERQTARYLALREKGMEALEDWIRERWRQAVHTCSNKPTEPDPVSEHLAYCYRDIRHGKGKIESADRLFASLERAKLPLFHRED